MMKHLYVLGVIFVYSLCWVDGPRFVFRILNAIKKCGKRRKKEEKKKKTGDVTMGGNK